jgi:phosphatidylserine decarboxylase
LAGSPCTFARVVEVTAGQPALLQPALAQPGRLDDATVARIIRRRDVMTGAASARVGEWLPSDQQVLGRWLDDLIAKADARGDVPLLPVVEEFRQLIERDPEIYMLFAFMLTQAPRKPTPADKPQVRTVDHVLKLFNHVMTHAPEYDEGGLVGFPINAIFDGRWAPTQGSPRS